MTADWPTIDVQGFPADDWPGEGKYDWGMGSRVIATDGFAGLVVGAFEIGLPATWIITVRGCRRDGGKLGSYPADELRLAPTAASG